MSPKRTSYSDAELTAIINRAVTEALAARNAEPCTYQDFLSCKPMYFKGTEGAIGLIRWIERMEATFSLCNCAEDNKVKFAAYTFQEGALTWWNYHVNTVGIETLNNTRWGNLKEMLMEEYCPREGLQRLEEEFWNLKVQNTNIASYTSRFQQLAILCPSMVDTEPRRINRYIRGLPENIQGSVASSKPTTIRNTIRLSHELMALMVSQEPSNTSFDNKRKPTENTTEPHKKPNTIKASTSNTKPNRGYAGNKPSCSKCNRHHDGTCTVVTCSKCKRIGHLAKDCRSTTTTSTPRTCYECGSTGHYRNECPTLRNKGNTSNNNNARGRAFVHNSRGAR